MNAGRLKRGWCPSLTRPMESGDGWLARVRPRAAVFTADAARNVAEAALRYGNGRIEITNRANLQIRGLRPETVGPFAEAMAAAGVADDGPTILVPPLAGADPSVAPETLSIAQTVIRGLDPRTYPFERPGGVLAPTRVDARHKAAHDNSGRTLAALPPKFGVLIDGGGALPLTGLSLDVTLRWACGAWRLDGVPVAAHEAAERVVARAWALAKAERHMLPREAAVPALGFHAYDHEIGAVLLAPPFGQMEAGSMAALADMAARWGDGKIRPTPWKSLAIAGIARVDEGFLRAEAHQIGIIADVGDPRHGVVTCVGGPACLRGTVDTQAAALALAATRRAGDPPVHLSGCAKGCAHPGPAAITLVGAAGRFDLVRDGRAGDRPVAHGLTLAEVAAMVQSVPA